MKFDKDCLLSAATSLAEHLRKSSIDSTDKRFTAQHCWIKDIKPIIRLWPRDKELLTNDIRCQLSLIIFYSGEAMKDAYNSLLWALDYLDDADFFLFQIEDSPILSSFPNESLSLIHLLIQNTHWGQKDVLKKCLMAIEKGNQKLKNTTSYLELEKMTH